MAVYSRVRIVIQGRVQGVNFRWETMTVAQQRGVRGWVRNRPDGNVEGMFEGASDAVESLITWCHQGPALADVRKVDLQYEAYKGEFDRFQILR